MQRSASRRTALLAALGGAALVVAAIHGPVGRAIGGRLAGCPLARGGATPEQVDRARRIAAAPPDSSHAPRAPSRQAFGFTLDVTTSDDVHAWARRAHVDCEDARAGLVRCTHVPDALGVVDELALAFDANGRLVNVTTFRAHLEPEAAAATARAIAAALASRLGPPTTSAGDFDGTDLATPGVAGLATISYRFADYVVDVTTMNLARSGPSIREHYMSAAD
jgi:hypothetical protein